MRTLGKLLKGLPLLVAAGILLCVAAVALAACDLLWKLFGRRRPASDTLPSRQAASVVIPNWNGRDLLEKYLGFLVEEMSSDPRNEVIVVDNASTDGSTEFVRQRYPTVRLLQLDRNYGFGGGSNAGIRAASNDIVILLNNDMRVTRGFLRPLLDAFTDEKVFAVACQIFFSDPAKKREETGQTQAWWANGGLRVSHRADPNITCLFPCFYPGGGSSAFDRRKLLELGGFDHLLRPFYLEDTDLGYLAWKRGWKVLYQPDSVVYHEHRGTIGRRFTPARIEAVLKKNYLLFAWKNIHEWKKLSANLLHAFSGAAVSLVAGDSPERTNAAAVVRAALQLHEALRSRWRARTLAVVSDTEAFRRPLGGYFRDRFEPGDDVPDRLRVLFVSPYPIEPPVHGGAVFMSQTVRELSRYAELHLLVMLDHPGQAAAQEALRSYVKTLELYVRPPGTPKAFGSLIPHAVREFASPDVEWILHRMIYLGHIDVLQIEYAALAQYGGPYRSLLTAVFEHDVYFQSVVRQLGQARGLLRRMRTAFEYLRALRYELTVLPQFDHIQVCSADNAAYLASFLPQVAERIQCGLRAGIDVSRYSFRLEGREPDTLLFLGSFRHEPNLAAVDWFVRRVYPRIAARRPGVRLLLAGSEPPPNYQLPPVEAPVVFLGQVPDVRDVLAKYAVFVCPVLSGSGVRVKLLEAFAAGIPVVSTRLGAEGLTAEDGEICALADGPEEFAEAVLRLLEDRQVAGQMALRARASVERNHDTRRMAARLAARYQELLAQKRLGSARESAASLAAAARRDDPNS